MHKPPAIIGIYYNQDSFDLTAINQIATELRITSPSDDTITLLISSSNEFAPGQKSEPSRLIVEVNNPTDDRIARFFKDKEKEEWKGFYLLYLIAEVGLLTQ